MARAATATSCLTSASGTRPRRSSSCTARPSFRAAEEELVCELLDARRAGRGDRARRRQRPLRARARGARAAPGRAAGHRGRAGLGAGGRACRRTAPGALGRPLARDREAFVALHAARRRALYEEPADAFLPPLARGAAPRVLDALRALCGGACRARACCGRRARSGDYPVLIGRGLLRAAGAGELPELWPLDRSRLAPVLRDRRDASARCMASGWASWPGRSRSRRGRAAQDARERGAVWRALVAARHRPRRPRRRARRRRRRRPRGLLRRDLPARACRSCRSRRRSSRRSTRPTAARPGVDLPEAKNYVGAYHQPAGVLVDPDTLATLPARRARRRAGWRC